MFACACSDNADEYILSCYQLPWIIIKPNSQNLEILIDICSPNYDHRTENLQLALDTYNYFIPQ